MYGGFLRCYGKSMEKCDGKTGGRGVSKSIWIPRCMISLGDIGLGGFEWGVRA